MALRGQSELEPRTPNRRVRARDDLDTRPVMMLIFGAGASNACLDMPMEGLSGQPPLTDWLLSFEEHDDYRGFSAQFRSTAIVRDRVAQLRNQGVSGSLEELLERVRSDAGEDPNLKIGLMAFRWYLQGLINWCGDRMDAADEGRTLYLSVLDRLLAWRRRHDYRLALVTFNYDMLIERALEHLGWTFSSSASYVGRDVGLFKVHGSVNFGRVLSSDTFGELSLPTPLDVIRLAPDLDETGHIGVVAEVGRATFYDEEINEPYTIAPAISVPVLSKPGFELPKAHLSTLRKWLPYVFRLVSIGWKARELEFREELSAIPARIPIEVVTKSAKGTADAAARLREAGLIGPLGERPGGFREWVTGGAFDSLLMSTDGASVEPGGSTKLDLSLPRRSRTRPSNKVPPVRPDLRVQLDSTFEYSKLTEFRLSVANAGAVFAVDAALNIHTFKSGEHRWWSSPFFDLGPGERRVFESVHAESGASGQRLRKLTDGLANEASAVAFQDSDGNRYRRTRQGTRTKLDFASAEAPSPEWAPW